MADFADVGGLADFTELNDAPATDSKGVFATLGASLRQSTTIGSALSGESVQRVYHGDAALDQAFTLTDIEALPSVYAPFAERFVGATKEGALALRRNIDGEMRDRETLERAGAMLGFASDVAVQFLDPINYIPIAGTALKGASLGGKLVRGAAAGLAGAALQEPVLFATQETRTGQEVMGNLLASVAFGAAFGGAAHVWELGRARWGDPVAAGRRNPVEIEPFRKEVAAHYERSLSELGYEPDVAVHNAEITASAYASLAARSGADPADLARAWKAKVTNEAAAVGAADADGLQYSQAGRVVTETPEFAAWFGDSKVVDAEGKPLVVYHGTTEKFEAFSPSSIGSKFGYDGKGFFFTSDNRTARSYSRTAEEASNMAFRMGPEGRAISDARTVQAYVSMKNPLTTAEIVNDPEFITAQYNDAIDFYDTNRALIERLSAGRDGVYVSIRGSDVIVPFDPTQIKSVHNRGTFDPSDPRILYQAGGGASPVPEQPLYVAHNLSADKLGYAAEVGGLPAPSLAVARADIGFDNFGEITLMGAPEMADPKGRGVTAFDADVYSPRQPRAMNEVSKTEFRAAERRIHAAGGALDADLSMEIGPDELQRYGLSALRDDVAVRYAFLQSKGKAPKVVYEAKPKVAKSYKGWFGKSRYQIETDPDFIKAMAVEFEKSLEAIPSEVHDRARARFFGDDGNPKPALVRDTAWRVSEANQPARVDKFATKNAVEAAIQKSKALGAEFEAWLEKEFGGIVGKKFFRDKNGRERPYQIDLLVKEMTRTIRGGEGYNYGAASIRAMVAEQFKSVARLKGQRGKIISHAEMGAIKDEASNEFLALSEKFKGYHSSGDDWGFSDIFSEFLVDLSKGRVADWQRKWFKSPVPDDLLNEARAYLGKLADLPTEYFEIKMQRAVELSEFKAAVVPKNAAKATVDMLKAAGLKIVKYDSAVDGARAAAVRSQGKLLFQSDPAAQSVGIGAAALSPEMRAVEIVAPVAAPSAGRSLPEMRRQYDADLKGSSVKMADGGEVKFSAKGGGKAFASGSDAPELRARAGAALREIVGAAHVVDAQPDRQGRAGLDYLVGASAVDIDGTVYPVRLLLRRSGEGNHFYEFQGFELQPPDRTSVGASNTSVSPLASTAFASGGRVNLGDIVDSFKGKPYFQGEGGARGSIEFAPQGPMSGQTIIRLMGGADASTFMHESAHFFLEIMNDLHVGMGDKSAFGDDIAQIEAWAGKRGEDGKFGRDAHEKFARGFEQYLRTGKAPSPALVRAFEAFKDWLIQVYASAAQLNVDVSPEMVRVYDRLLVPDISEMAGAYPPRARSANSLSAAAADESMFVDPDTGEWRALTASDYALRNSFARAVETSGVGLTPNNRAARSRVTGVKTLMASMVEDQRDTKASRGGAVGAAVETLVKNDRGLVEAKLYAILGKDGKRIVHPKLSHYEFGERVLNALANPQDETDGPVLSAAAELHSEVIAPLEGEMRRIGMLADTQGWKQDQRYAPHNWSAGRILENLGLFRGKMGARIDQALNAAAKVQLDEAEKRGVNIQRAIDALEMGGLRRREDMQRRFSGDEVNLSEEAIRDLIMQSRNAPDKERPQSLRQFIIANGGFWLGDPLASEIKGFEYKGVGFVKRNRFQFSAAGDNGGGRPLDEMRELAEAAGFLREGSSMSDLIDAVGNDVAGRRVYSIEDMNDVMAWEAYDELIVSLTQAGVIVDGRAVLRATSETQRQTMLKAISAMEKLDTIKAEKLREKLAQQEELRAEAADLMDDPASRAAEVEKILDEVQARLTKQDQIWQDEMTVTVERAGPLKKRTIDVTRGGFSEFMDNDALNVIGRHMHRMIAEYHLTKRFGRADMKHDLAMLEAEAGKYAATLSGADAVAFSKKMAADVAMIQTTRDQLRGTHAKGQTGQFAEAGRFMSALAYTLQLGDVVTSSVSDIFRPVMAHGVGLILRHGAPRLKEGLRQAIRGLEAGDYLRSDRAGVVVERIGSSRMMAMMDLEDTYHPNTKATRLSGNLAGIATRVSFMDRWNQMGKWIASGLFMDRMGEMAGRSWGELRPKDQYFLSINRISQNQWRYVSDMILAHGTQERGMWNLNLEKWADADLATLTRAAMRKDTDSLIVTPSIGDKIQSLGGVDFTNPIGKMLLQYKSFWISGHERIMLRAAQNPDAAATASGALFMVVMGMFIDEVKAFTGNYGGAGEPYDFEKRWERRNWGTTVMAGVDRSGIIPMWMEANNMLERGLSLPLAYRAAGGLGMLAGADNMGTTSSRWAGRNQLGSLLGPSAGIAQDVVQVGGDLARELQGYDEGISGGTVSAGKRLIPYQNAPAIRELLNWFLVPAAKEALEP